MARNVMKHTIHKWGAISYQFMRLLDPHIRRPNQNRVKPVGTKSQVSLKFFLDGSPKLNRKICTGRLKKTFLYDPHFTIKRPSCPKKLNKVEN